MRIEFHLNFVSSSVLYSFQCAGFYSFQCAGLCVHQYQSLTLFRILSSFSINVSFLFAGSSSEYCISLSCHISPSLPRSVTVSSSFLSFIALIVLRSAGQISCIMFPSLWVLTTVFFFISSLKLKFWVLGKNTIGNILLFLHHVKEYKDLFTW